MREYSDTVIILPIGTGNASRICAYRRPARARRERCGFRPPAVAPARRFEIAVTTFQRRYFGSGQHLDIRLRLDALDKVIGHSRLQTSATGQQPYLLYVTRSHVDLEFAAAIESIGVLRHYRRVTLWGKAFMR